MNIHQNTKKAAFLVACTVSACVFSGLARAQDTHNWNDPAGGVYGTFTKWTPIGVPAALDTARFKILVEGEIPISFLQNRSAANLEIVNGDIVLTGSGISAGDRTYTLDNATIGEDGHLILQRVFQERDLNFAVDNLLTVQGDLSIRDSALVTTHTATVDSGPGGSVAHAFVTGANDSGDQSRWNATDMTVGADDRGELHVEAGGILSTTNTTLGANADGDGKLIVRGVAADGAPSTWSATTQFFLGDGGIGTLRVEGGATASTPGGALLGKLSNSFGLVSVDGVDAAGNPSHWNAGQLTIQAGVIEVLQGAHLTSQETNFGVNRSGTISVKGVDQAGNPSTWTTAVTGDGPFNRLAISRNAEGRLEIFEGGRVVSTGPVVIAVNSGVNGRVSMFGSSPDAISTWTNTGDVFVGGSQELEGGNGSISVGPLSRVEVAGDIKIWGTGSMTIDGTLVADKIEKTEGGEFHFTAGLLQTARFEGDLLNQGGALAPGPAAGTTTIIGEYTQQSDATLAMDIGGTVAGITHDLVNISGNTILDGQLAVKLIDGFTPNALDEFTVLAANSLFDSFDNVLNGQRLTTANGGGSFVVNYGIGSAFDESRIILSDFETSAILPGDYNEDGTVNAADYTVWRDNVGAPAGTLPNDTDGGVIGAAQYDTWKSNFGSGASLLASSHAVPEPSSLVLLLALATIGWVSRGRRTSQRNRPASVQPSR